MKACAFVIGSEDGPSAALMDMAKSIGFETVLAYGGIGLAEQQVRVTPLCFFLFAAVTDVASLKGVADAIRFNPSRKIRFSPLIYFAESPSIDTIKRCINMGFDDVVTLPFVRRRLEERIGRQIERTCVYYETAGYFGPDRRDRIGGESGQANRGDGGQFRRLEIVRSLTNGVNVVRDDFQVMV